MDKNPNQFPTLLIVCLLMAIVLYVIASIIGHLHQRKTAANLRTSRTKDNSTLPSSDVNNEEQEMANYLADEEKKTAIH